MTDHTTHFDDCGCLRARLEAERDALRLRVAALEAQVYGIIDTAREMDFRGDWIHQRSTIAKRALSGDTTALRPMLVKAAQLGFKDGRDYEALSTEAALSWPKHDVWCDAICDRILGADKGGGE